MIVIDASVGVKWFLDERDSQAAIDILVAEAGKMAAPDLFGIEVSSALVREGNIRKERASDMLLAIDRLAGLLDSFAVEAYQTTPANLVAAAGLAIELGHPLKDCIYLALAIELNCELSTCDQRFAAKAKDIYRQVHVLSG